MPRHEPIAGHIDRTQDFPEFALTQTSYEAGTMLEPHRHEEAIFSFAVAGGTSVSVGRSTEWCDESDLLYLPADEPHANSYPRPSVRVHVRLMSPFWRQFMKERSMGRGRPVRHPIADELRQAARAALRGGDPGGEALVACSVVDVLAVLPLESRGRHGGPDRWLLRLREFLDAHCTGRLTTRDLVEVSGHHPVHISRAFHQHFGRTISAFVRERRVLRAAVLLRRTSRPLSDIALECGFYDQSHFTNTFRRYMGRTPSSYRSPDCSNRLSLDRSGVPSP